MPRIRLDEHGVGLHLGEADGPRRRILLISPGWGSSGYYPAEVLERDAGVIAPGTHMYVNHPNDMTIQRPNERNIRDLAATIEAARWDGNGPEGPGIYADAAIIPSYAPMIDELAEHIGVSIRGAGEGERGEAEGRKGRIITALHAVESVDFVAKAGRGGKVLELVESLREALSANELRDAVWDAVRSRWATDDVHVYLQDFSADDSWVVFEQYTNDEETYWRATLTVDGDTVEVADDAVQVEREVTYVPVDDVTEALTEARQSVQEARNVGQWFESHIHLDFTRRADEMAADGRLTRDERIALSNAIGDGLQAFTDALTDTAPHLYDRDLFDEPTDPPTITTEEAEVPTVEELTARVSALEAERDTAIEERDTAAAERDEALAEAARLTEADRQTRARDIVREALAHVRFESDAIRDDVVAARAANPPLTEADELDEDALRTRVEEAYPQPQGSRVTGLGESTTTPTPPPARRTAEDYQAAGLSESAAKVAAIRPA